jgi:hypothetical protein
MTERGEFALLSKNPVIASGATAPDITMGIEWSVAISKQDMG